MASKKSAFILRLREAESAGNVAPANSKTDGREAKHGAGGSRGFWYS